MIKKKIKKGEKSVWQYFTESFKTLWKHPIILIPFLISIILSEILLIITKIITTDNPIMQDIIANGTITSFVLGPFIQFVAAYVIAGIIILLINAFFISGAIGMILDIMKNKKISLKTMLRLKITPSWKNR